MRRALARLLSVAAWALLSASALAGLLLSAVVAFSASSVGRPVVAGLLVGELDAAVAGRLTLEAIEVLPQGGIELRGLRVFDPEGTLVLDVTRARLFPDLTRLGARDVGVVLELEEPSVLLQAGPDGSTSLGRALAPTRPAPPAPARPGPALERPAWTLRLTRLTVRRGNLLWQQEDGSTVAEGSALDLDAEGAIGPRGGFLGLRLRGEASAPVAGPLALELSAQLSGDRLEVPLLTASLGATRLEALGEGDLATRGFRAAVTRLGVAQAALGRLAPGVRPGGDLAGAAYAVSDGRVLAASLEILPERGAGGAAGRGEAAVALRLDPARRAIGLEVSLDELDPSAVVAQAPAGRISLSARGAAAGAGLSDGRGHLSLELAPSRLRGVELGPATAAVRVEPGVAELTRLEARLPGLSASGRGRWRDGGSLGGELTLEATDLGALGRALAALQGASLPPLRGRLGARVTVTGTSAAPAVRLGVDAPLLEAGGTRLERVTLAADVSGPLRAPEGKGRLEVARLAAGSFAAQRVALVAGLADRIATLSLDADLGERAGEPAAVRAAARVGAGLETAELTDLSLAWSGLRYALVRPATVALARPAVDRLELASGARRLALTGGVDDGGALDARLELHRLDLAWALRAIAPASLGLGGELSADVRATGRAQRPQLQAHLEVQDGTLRGLAGLGLAGDATWDGRERRLGAHLALRRAAGGILDVVADLPLPLAAARPAARLELGVIASGWSAETLAVAAGVATPVSGTLGGQVALAGTLAAPTLDGALHLEEGRLEGGRLDALGPLSVALQLSTEPGAARLGAVAEGGGARLLAASVRLPLELHDLLLDPAGAERLATAPLEGWASLDGLDLAKVAEGLDLPEPLAGRLSGEASVGGTVRAPRGTVQLSVDGLAYGPWRGLAARLDGALEAARTTVALRATLGGAEALLLEASLGAAPERLADAALLRRAPLALSARVPRLLLAGGEGGKAPLTGRLDVGLTLTGTLAAPAGRLDLAGERVVVDGRTLGDLDGKVRLGAGVLEAEAVLRPEGGGRLEAALRLLAPLGLDTDAAALRGAPAELRLVSEGLDLAVLPALAPGLVRSAQGSMRLDLKAVGPLARLRPRGSVRVQEGRVAVAELGEWSGLELEASVDERLLEVSRLAARRGRGRLEGRLAARIGEGEAGVLDGKLTLQALTAGRAGVEFATIDLEAQLGGTFTSDRLDATLTVPSGLVRLPRKTPRALQPLEPRDDIRVGRVRERGPSAGAAPAGGPAHPFEASCRLLVPGRLQVRSEAPAMELELKADVTARLGAGELLVEGPVEVVRGHLEPMAGRVFQVERAKVTFTGAGWKAGLLDAAARYDNPAAQVTVTVGGTLTSPTMKLSSRPSLDDASIAMLLATGRAELKANTSEVSALSGKDVGMAAAGAAVTLAFKSFVSDRLPVDQVSLDATTLRAGKYLTDKLFVGYTRRFDAKVEEGENANEVKAEYQVSPRWNLEVRYGDAQAGDASLIWSKDY